MYMKFNIVRLDAHLLNGKHAVANIVFQDGCNIILTNSNTQGKSSVINSLAIALGFDELVKGNISALVNDTVKIQGADQPIHHHLILQAPFGGVFFMPEICLYSILIPLLLLM